MQLKQFPLRMNVSRMDLDLLNASKALASHFGTCSERRETCGMPALPTKLYEWVRVHTKFILFPAAFLEPCKLLSTSESKLISVKREDFKSITKILASHRRLN